MKESIGSTYLFEIVIVFVLLFTGYLCLSINYSRSYAVKNNIVHAIERERGNNYDTRKRIKNYLNKVGFKSNGVCPDGYTAYDLDGHVRSDKGIYCIQKVMTQAETDNMPTKSYYRVVVFYKLDLPVMNTLFSFKNYGDTYQIYDPIDDN